MPDDRDAVLAWVHEPEEQGRKLPAGDQLVVEQAGDSGLRGLGFAMPTLDREDRVTGQEHARVVRVRCKQHGVRVGQRDGRVIRDASLVTPILPDRIVGSLGHVGDELVLRLLPGLIPGLALLVPRGLEPLPKIAQDLLVQRGVEGDFFDGTGQLTHGALLKLLSLL